RTPDAGRGPRRFGRQRLHARDERLRGSRHTARNAHHEVAMDVPAVRGAVTIEQPLHRRDVPEVEQLELGHDLALAHVEIQPLDDPPAVEQPARPNAPRPGGGAGAAGPAVEPAAAGAPAVGPRPAAGDLDDEVGRLPYRVDRGPDPAEVERGLRVVIAYVDV